MEPMSLLPLSGSETLAAQSVAEPPSATWEVAPRTARVLIIDDNEGIRAAFSRVMRAQGVEVDTAPDGAEALILLEQHSYDAIATDIHMPKLSGMEVLRAIRAKDLDVPVIVMTGEPSVDSAAKAVEFGALQYLMKPLGAAEFASAMIRAVQLHRMTLAKLRAADLLGADTVRATDLIGLDIRLNSALASLWMAFQPIVNAKDRSTYGHEALLRSGEPALPHPGAVLEAAERLGRLDEVGRRVRAAAAEAMAGADHAGVLFVNLHPRDLFDPDLIDERAPLTRIASRVVLEITERASLGTGETVTDRVRALRTLGYRIAIDDLGAGYSGLSSFALLEPDLIKLDIALVRDVHQSRTKQRLIRSMTMLAKDMNILTVAEGIEVAEEREKLCELGCDLLQGYLFARPGRPFPQVSW
jgi:EAL domain-containing protein (putative c-di-GMP-specific phosphodiesterase class I)